MGDSYDSDPMNRVFNVLRNTHPLLFIHSIYINPDDSKDQEDSFFGNVNNHLEIACEQISQIKELQNGFDCIGFSQGGLFIRSLIETCQFMDNKVNNLITFGSPHTGVSDLPTCKDNDWICKQRNQFLKKQVWRENIQTNIVSAQYFRDLYNYETYLSHSKFIVYLNNELPGHTNTTYAQRLSSINGNFVMVMFEKDTILVPKQSAWFQDEDISTGNMIELVDTDLYNEDWLGIKKLDENHQLRYLTIDDEHMVISDDFLTFIAENYLG
ncbi:palmitoyl-protein thioesterase family protein [Ascoidea rubescens DSM 1968]|uniref:Palmitoyl-protein thioesterase 1 n=1 Tax=Ascoidea rubescens DSM 1968 TaxID=1344418 RepID=A0A1D2VIQ2_9ASCO|nr:alpha/beta-hydrolase [Ascoidea rubescens DSM 1968]ODV61508.1 alpha/beta-hydrolase [Ascoidea rubescens DSM 1968]